MQPPHRLVNLLQQPGLAPLRGFTFKEIRHLTYLWQPNTNWFYIQYTEPH
jgi:hypothetical protein